MVQPTVLGGIMDGSTRFDAKISKKILFSYTVSQ